MTATWVALIAHSRIILNQQYIPCSLYQTCFVHDSVLDYRLSLTTDNITCTIYTYCVSLLKEKIAETHKKFTTSVSFPVSVSSNKYASLVVEGVDTQCTMDCADTTASFVSPSVFNSATVPSMAPMVPTVQVVLE